MIFYLYFCTKSIETGVFRRVGSLRHCCLDLHWCLDMQRGGCLAQSDLTQCLQYLPTCFLMAQWLQFHQPSKQSTTEAPSLSWWLFPVHIALKCMSERSQRVTVWIELIPLCAFYQDKFYLNHWMEFHTHSTLPRLLEGGRCMKCFICYCANCIKK